MTTAFKTRLLQHLATKRNSEKGFTLIELLVVIIIIGVLSAVALPQFLQQTDKARLAGGKSQVGAILRAQQAFRLSNNKWAGTCAELASVATIKSPTAEWDFNDCNDGPVTARDSALTVKASGLVNTPTANMEVQVVFDPATGEATWSGVNGSGDALPAGEI
jgi:prepilin-type N-terminal cleavage/methylation domain-containing protein